MNCLELVGFLVATAPVVLEAAQNFRHYSRLAKQVGPITALRLLLVRSISGVTSTRSGFRDLRRVHGALTAWVLIVAFQDAVDHMDLVARQILPAQPAEVSAFMQSVASSFHLIGVSVSIRLPRNTKNVWPDNLKGAVIAQVAITALSPASRGLSLGCRMHCSLPASSPELFPSSSPACYTLPSLACIGMRTLKTG
jgi:hypothetical protein